MNDAITLGIEVVFFLTFVLALADYARKRDLLSLDVVLVFSTTVVFFLLDLASRVGTALGWGAVPAQANLLAAAWLLAGPLLTLRLASRLGPVPRVVLAGATVAFALPVLAFVLISFYGATIPLPLALLIVAVFVSTDLAAAGYLLRHRRRRTGSARMRLFIAAVSTLAFAVAIFAAGVATARPESAGVSGIVSRLMVLGAAAGYLLAFFPPAALRRSWQVGTAYRFSQDLLDSSPSMPTGKLWGRFAVSVATITGSEGVLIFREDGDDTPTLLASAWPEVAARARFDQDELARLAALAWSRRPGTPVSGPRLLRGHDGRYVTAVAARTTVGPVALVLASRYQSLFAADDCDVLVSLAREVALLADRRTQLTEQERLTAALSKSLAAKSDFLASMSHELRTPLTAIIGFSDLMRGEPAAGGRADVPEEWIEHIHRSGKHLLALVNDVLDLSKVEAGRLELELTAFDVKAAIAESIAGLRPLADKKNLNLTTDVEPGTVVADRGRFRQILYNLLSNAIKYTPDGGDVAVHAQITPDGAIVSVADSGIGISEDDLPHLFEEFRQLGSPEQRQPGTGLGLSLTRRLVEAHGGTLEVSSAPDMGSTFTVILPRLHVPGPEDGEPAASPTHQPATAASSATGDVLVIEDDPGSVRLLRAYIEGAGFSMRVATHGEGGLAEAHRRIPAAIVLDILLPGIDGWEVLRRLKSDPDLRNIPVLIASVTDEREVGLALGATDYFIKPLDRDALLACLERYIETARPADRPVRVLAIDDDPAALEMIAAALRPSGAEVLTAQESEEGLALARSKHPDLVICDLLMPEPDGFAVVAALKADARTETIPIVVLTAHELTANDKVRLNGHVMDVLAKGADGEAGLRAWLTRVVPATTGVPSP